MKTGITEQTSVLICDKELQNQTIVYGVLNWGLGHATRSAVLIRKLLQQGNIVYIVSEGDASIFLKKQFPFSEHFLGPLQQIHYPKSKTGLKRSLFAQGPRFLRQIKREKQFLKELCTSIRPDYIISDGRYGFYHEKITSIFTGHQFNLQVPFFEKAINFFHQKQLKKFDGIWIMDRKSSPISGVLSQVRNNNIPTRHIGIQTALTSDTEQEKKIDCLILLSGIEEQRQRLEKALLERNWPHKRRVVLVRGVLDVKENCKHPFLEIQNYATPKQLEKLLSQSRAILCRSGYSTLMDLDSFAIKKLLIPTPGQTEQEYLAQYHAKNFPGTLVLQERDLKSFDFRKWLCSN